MFSDIQNNFSISVLAFVSFAVFLSGCATAQYVPSSTETGEHASVEHIMKPLNDARTKGRMCGSVYFKPVQPVRWSEKLAQAALNHSLDMAKNGFMSHKGSDGSSTDERLAQIGYHWSAYGENVGEGYRTAGDAMDAWLKSEMHCKNMMDPDFKEAGVASARNKNLRTFWTLVLGAPKK
jgi:uncharacterized protein YkwD